MLKNFFKITLRTLVKNRLYSFVNISGLAIGIACFILISLFVIDDLTYDSFNTKIDRIFRVNAHYKVGDNRFNLADSPIPLGKVLVDEYPEIEKAVRITKREQTYVKKGDEYLKEKNFYFADSTLFDVFTIKFLQGDSKSALAEPNSIVITTKAAEKYFPGKNPVGERLILSDGMEFLVRGVAEPLPHNSHFKFDFVASYNSLAESRVINWFGEFAHTYVLTRPGISAKDLNKKIFAVTEKHIGPIIKAGFGLSYQQFLNNGNDYSFVFVPLRSIYLHSDVFNEFEETGDINKIYLFSAIAVFILIIACINFINLATARSSKRANEIGVRKVLGSKRIQLVLQYLSESVILCFISVIFSIVIVELVMPYFNQLSNKELSLNLFGNIYIAPILTAFTLIVGVAAGLYPALLLSSFKPVLVLKSKTGLISKKGMLRKGLVIFQFAASIILFIGTFTIYEQMEYIRNKNLGFNKDQVLIIKNMDSFGNQQTAFANSVRENSNVLYAALSRGLPSFDLMAHIYRKEGESRENHTLVNIWVDYDFFNTYKLEMKSGRYFSREMGTDTLGIILNEAAVKKLNYSSDPINSLLLFNLGEDSAGMKYTVIGVVKDFVLQSLKEEVRPAALLLLKNQTADYLSVKFSSNNIHGSIEYLSKLWKGFGQSKPMEYSFFDEQFDELYRSEIQAGKVFTVFALLAIVIACLGLFGLAAFTAEQKTKEIGVRKVLGASIPGIVSMLSKEFIILVALANIIAWPSAYYIMNQWLKVFTYKTEIGIGVFIAAGLAVLIIALITVFFQAVKAAAADPVKSLRYE